MAVVVVTKIYSSDGGVCSVSCGNIITIDVGGDGNRNTGGGGGGSCRNRNIGGSWVMVLLPAAAIVRPVYLNIIKPFC